MANKVKLDFDRTRPFLICTNQQQFQKLGSSSRSRQKKSKILDDIVEVSKAQFHKSNQTNGRKAKDIVVPPFQDVPLIKKKANRKNRPLPLNYIRYSRPYPSPAEYQLLQADIYFLEQLNKEFPHLQQQFLKEEIIELEKRTGRQNIQKKYIQHQCNEYVKELNLRRHNFDNNDLNKIGKMIFKYWCCQRKLFNYPLYRPLWKPNQNQYDYHGAFRRREKEKRSLRRFNRTSERQLILNLIQEFQTAEEVCQKILQRQATKLQLLETQILQWKLKLQGQGFHFQQPENNCMEDEEIKQGLLRQLSSEQQEQESSEQMDEKQYSLNVCKFILNAFKPKEMISKRILCLKKKPRQSYAQRQNKFKDLGSERYEQIDNNTVLLYNKGTHAEYFSSEVFQNDIKELIQKFHNRNRHSDQHD